MDVIARLGEAWRYEDLEFTSEVYEGVPVRLATPRMLWRMKRDTARLQDRADAARINDKFGFEGS